MGLLEFSIISIIFQILRVIFDKIWSGAIIKVQPFLIWAIVFQSQILFEVFLRGKFRQITVKIVHIGVLVSSQLIGLVLV